MALERHAGAPSSATSSSKYESIQACRAVAALLVMFFHLGGNLAKDKYFGADGIPLQRFFVFGGSAGVGFFFVLSGFIIVLIHRQDFGRPARLWSYLRKRVVRIYPTYLLIFGGVYGAALMVPSLRDAMPTDLGVLAESLFLLPQDPAVVGGTGAPVIVVAWSLQYEVVFYAIVALAIALPVLCGAVVVALAANFVWHLIGGAQQFPASFFANELMLLFAMGVCAALIEQGRWRLSRPLPMAVLAGAAFFGIGAVAAWRNDPNNGYFNLAYGVCAALAIVSLTQAERAQPARFVNRGLSLLGDASYSLYLIHFPLIAVLCKLAVAAGLRGVGGMALSFAAITLTTVAASVAFHLWIERPVLRLLSRRGAHDASKSPGAGRRAA
jgi:peptidoglycan/LPS O-acetylase OafA/YrhL